MKFSRIHLLCAGRVKDHSIEYGYELNPMILISAQDPIVIECINRFKEIVKEKKGEYPDKIGLFFSVWVEEKD